MNGSIRSRITTLNLLLVLVPTIVSGTLGFWTASNVIRDEAIRAVGITANFKKELFVFRLIRQKERATEFLNSIRSICMDDGRMDQLCAQRLLTSFMDQDSIIDADINIPGMVNLHQGPNADTVKDHPPFAPRQLAQFSSRSAKIPSYIIEGHGKIPGSLITVRYDTKLIEELFIAPSELGPNGETFLADANGFFLTSPRSPGHQQGSSHPIDVRPMVMCLSRHNSEMLADDYRSVPVIHGFKYVPEIGGGCIMAHIQQDVAFAPLRKLRDRILFSALVFALLAMVISFWIAQRMSTQFTLPLMKLNERMKAAQAGDLNSPVSVTGPKEIVNLSSVFADLVAQLKLNIEIRDDFVAIVSHDLKNPLTLLGLYISRLEKNIQLLRDEEKLKLLPQVESMRGSLKRMLEMIGAVLSLTAIRSGNFTLLREHHSVNLLLTEVIDSFRPLMAEKGIALIKEAPAYEITTIFDRGRILQVFSNLLGNALKYTPKGGEVTVQLLEREKEIQFLVRDSGPGIPSDVLASIFERYHQLGQGGDFSVGLGLFIAKEIVSAHGGRIWAESEQGLGTTFYFTLPIKN